MVSLRQGHFAGMTFQPLTYYNGIQHALVLIGNTNTHV